MSTRINARLPAEVARKVAYLQSVTGASATLVLRDSIERYYAQMTSETGSPSQLLEGFVGCVEGPRDLSSSYKAELLRSLKKKA